MKKLKICALIIAAMMMVFTLAACGETENNNDDKVVENNGGNGGEVTDSNENNETPDEISGTVSTDGSTSMESVIGYLMEAYMELNDAVTVTYNPTGSGSGIQAVTEGRCDIGLASRNLTDEELESLDETVLAIDGIAIIVNPENTVTDLTIEQIAGIYTGTITNWRH